MDLAMDAVRLSGKNLTLAYQKKKIIEDLDIAFLKGKISVIIGPNGCGKSTLLKGLGRVLKIEQGAVFFNDADIQQLSPKEIARNLAFLPQGAIPPDDATVRDVVELGRYPHQNLLRKPSLEDKTIVDEVLQQTELSELENRPVQSLSGGQKQRVWIAMALAQKTPILLLDEPTTYLDLGHQLEILNLLHSLNQQLHLTIVMVLHDLNMAARYADYMIAMKEGRICCQGTPDEVMQPQVIKELFGVTAIMGKDPVNQKPLCLRFE